MAGRGKGEGNPWPLLDRRLLEVEKVYATDSFLLPRRVRIGLDTVAAIFLVPSPRVRLPALHYTWVAPHPLLYMKASGAGGPGEQLPGTPRSCEAHSKGRTLAGQPDDSLCDPMGLQMPL